MLLISSLVLGALTAGPAVSSDLPRGEVVEAVSIEADAGQSYALYLPKAFVPDRRWPILYAFDPGARGKVAVDLFKTSAESYGWIVVSSNNARNGPLEPLRAAVKAVWNDTQARFPVDPHRVYFAGMSGGSGPAWEMGREFGAGVIACGGPERPRSDSLRGLRFALYALAGDGDFNYGPMRSAALGVLREGGRARFDVFEGGHGWPSAESLGRAVEWLEILAMQGGARSRDETLASAVYARTIAVARSLETTNAHHAALLYRSMEQDFEGLVPMGEIAGFAQRIGGSPAARKAEKAEVGLLRREGEERDRLDGWRRAISSRQGVGVPLGGPGEGGGSTWDALERVDPRASLIEALARHGRRMQEGKRTAEVLLSQRTYEASWVRFIEAARWEMATGKPAEAIIDLELCVALRPESAGLRVELAKALLAAKQRKKALESLREALKLGFRSVELLRKEEAFESLRGDQEFEAILGAMTRAGTPSER